jgi:glycosyltransferase involved in cell wall biosynthesis
MAVIAFNARLIIPGRLDGIGWFSLETIQRIASAHPEHSFHLIFDRPAPDELFASENIVTHHLYPPARRPWLVDLFMDYAVPRLLNRIQANLFVGPDGFLSRRTSVAQLAVMHDLNFEHHPEWLPPRVAKHYRARFREFSSIATRIATVSEFSKRDISSRYGVDEDRIDAVYNGLGGVYVSADFDASRRQEMRSTWADNAEYFVYVGTLHARKNIEGLLGAFAAYCRSGGLWNLVIVGTPLWKRKKLGAMQVYQALEPEVKVRVCFTGWQEQETVAAIVATAGAMVFIPWYEGFGVPLIEAFSVGTPVILSNRTALPEIAGDAARLVDPSDEDAVAQSMLYLEKNPQVCLEMAAAGRIRAQAFTWDRSARALWSSIARTAGLPDDGPTDHHATL